jgi:acetyl esterase/lipase
VGQGETTIKRLTLLILFLTIGFGLVTCTSYNTISQDTTLFRTWQDLAYANGSKSQKLDIYLPKDEQDLSPIIIWIHGGGWLEGSEDILIGHRCGSIFDEALDRGYALVSIGYRLSSEAIFPAQIYDVKAAIRWIKAHAQEYNLNPNKIALWGGSAGGHLAALAGTSGYVKEIEDLGMGNADQSSRVQAVVDWFGPIDFLTIDDQLAELGMSGQGKNNPDAATARLVGGLITHKQELVKMANPMTYITPDDPPFLIQHGTNDNLVPITQSKVFAQELQSVIGVDKVTLTIFEGAGHGDYGRSKMFTAPSNTETIFRFLDKYLK